MPSPRTAAERVLDDLGINNIEDLKYLEEIAWERNVMVQRRHLDGAEARIAVIGSRGIVTLSTAVTNRQRQRFSIAHELGHFELHRYSGTLLCGAQDIYQPPTQQISRPLEQQANQFAAALLLPDRFLQPLCTAQNPSLDHIKQLSESFDTSLTATALRYAYFCEAPIAIVMSQENRVKWFQGSKDFKEMLLGVEVNCEVDPGTQAALYFKGKTLSRRGNHVKAAAWLVPGPYRRNARIFEQSWVMPSYKSVLTLLWVDPDIESEVWDATHM